ncbi:MAG: Xaa-Pro dipeptidyl-peptidase [Saprospiraceae bacterium]|nr:Xaa-Pro dipeptidyl-peptidase [Saprospiraceae bacterium]
MQLVLATSCVLVSIPAFAQNGPLIEDGMAQVVEAFNDSESWIREELWVETEFDSDGDGKLDRMHVAVTRQRQTETDGLKVPVIYGSSPYYSGVSADEYFWDIRHEIGVTPPERPHRPQFTMRARPYISNGFVSYWVPRGFAVVHSESPGTGLSEGCPTVGGKNESLAPKAVIDWLNGRAKGFKSIDGNEQVRASWCTGKVGMTGTSYNGTLPLAAATTGVAGLEAIIPDAPNTSYWHYYRANGLVRHPGGYPGEDIDVLYDFIHSQVSDRRDWCNENIRDGEHARGMDRLTGDYNDFWAGRDYTSQLDKIKAAVFLSHGLSDWNVMPDHSIRIYEALRAKGKTAKLYLHQGGHGGPPPAEMMNRWFTRFLYGVDNGADQEDKFWVVREGDERDAPTSYPDYPNPAARDVRLYLSGDGIATGSLGTMRVPWQGEQTIMDNVSFPGDVLARAEWTNHRLLFVTDRLKEDLHLSGRPEITIRASSNKPAVNLSVWLVSLPWRDGRRPRGGVITRGWADLQNHDSLTESKPLVPGKFYEMTFKIEPDDQIIPKGQQIGLMIFSSDRDFTLHPRPGTMLTVDVDGTTITLPVVGGGEALLKAMGQ